MTHSKENEHSNNCTEPCSHCILGRMITGDMCMDCGGTGCLEKTKCAGFGCKLN